MDGHAEDSGPAPSPVVSLSGARASYVGPGLALDPHANAAATVLIALDDPFWLRLADEEPQTTSVAVIPPRTHHHLRSRGGMIFVYLDGLSDDYAALCGLDLAAARRNVLRHSEGGVDALCDALGVPPRAPPDPRVAAVVEALCARPQAFSRVEDAAAMANLSSSRFQRLFRRAVGVPFRRYRLWRRMAVVAVSVGAGRSLTAAAHEAGFASSSHLSASFRQMFGMRPRDFVALGAQLRIAG